MATGQPTQGAGGNAAAGAAHDRGTGTGRRDIPTWPAGTPAEVVNNLNTLCRSIAIYCYRTDFPTKNATDDEIFGHIERHLGRAQEWVEIPLVLAHIPHHLGVQPEEEQRLLDAFMTRLLGLQPRLGDSRGPLASQAFFSSILSLPAFVALGDALLHPCPSWSVGTAVVAASSSRPPPDSMTNPRSDDNHSPASGHEDVGAVQGPMRWASGAAEGTPDTPSPYMPEIEREIAQAATTVLLRCRPAGAPQLWPPLQAHAPPTTRLSFKFFPNSISTDDRLGRRAPTASAFYNGRPLRWLHPPDLLLQSHVVLQRPRSVSPVKTPLALQDIDADSEAGDRVAH